MTSAMHAQTPTEPPVSDVQTRMEHLLGTGECWNDLSSHPFPGHAFYLTPTTGLHYGPSGPALAIVFGPDGRMDTGDESPGAVYAFCR